MKLSIQTPRLRRALAPAALSLAAGASLFAVAIGSAAPGQAPTVPGPTIECGEFGAARFRVTLAPCVGYAIGDSIAAKNQACLMAAICVDRALRQAAGSLGVPMPNCDDGDCTPPKHIGCFPALAFDDLAADVFFDTQVVITLDGTPITICTISARANALIVTGCAQCLAEDDDIVVL